MAERWTSARMDDALTALADVLDVPDADALAPFTPDLPDTPEPAAAAPRAMPQRWRRVAVLVAAAAVVLAVLVVAIPPARDTVARWFGVRVERDDGAPATGSFTDDVAPLPVDDALTAAGLDAAALDAAGLGRPAAAAVPPEGGVLLAWDDGATTLWVRPGDDDVVVVKQVGDDAATGYVAGLGDYAVRFDGNHALDTPWRRVAAGRVLWWLDDGRQWRLESDLDATAMLAAARALADAT